MASGDLQIKYGTSAALTITLGSLATSSTRTAGRESTSVTTPDGVVDYQIGGKIKTGTSPTVNKQIDIWIVAAYSDGGGTPVWPDVFDGTDSPETVTSENVRANAMKLLTSIYIDNTSDRDYPFGPINLSSIFGGVGCIPKYWDVFVAHDTGVNLNSTNGNHEIIATPIYYNVIP